MIMYNDNENTLTNCVDFIESFDVFKNGESKTINKTSKEFDIIKDKLEKLFLNSRLMPAFGVSMHNETLNELQYGEWLKINFNEEMNKNGLPFTSLLFKLEEVQGFNLIRLHNNKYDGRCLYLDLDEQTNLRDLIN